MICRNQAFLAANHPAPPRRTTIKRTPPANPSGKITVTNNFHAVAPGSIDAASIDIDSIPIQLTTGTDTKHNPLVINVTAIAIDTSPPARDVQTAADASVHGTAVTTIKPAAIDGPGSKPAHRSTAK